MAGSNISLAKLERALKWEKQKQDVAMNALIVAKAVPIVNKLIEIGMEGNPNTLNSLLDRAFGKARQNIGLDGGATDKPIVFMPASLMTKYAIREGQYTAIDQPEDGSDPVAVQIDPVDEDDLPE